jgi:hypothetical protein
MKTAISVVVFFLVASITSLLDGHNPNPEPGDPIEPPVPCGTANWSCSVPHSCLAWYGGQGGCANFSIEDRDDHMHRGIPHGCNPCNATTIACDRWNFINGAKRRDSYDFNCNGRTRDNICFPGQLISTVPCSGNPPGPDGNRVTNNSMSEHRCM